MSDVFLPIATFAGAALCVWALLSIRSLRAMRTLKQSMKQQTNTDTQHTALDLYQARLAELDDQLSNDLIDQTQYQTLKQDLEVDVMTISSATEDRSSTVSSSTSLMRFIPLLMLPIIGVLLAVFLSNSEVNKATEWAELKATWGPDIERYFTEQKELPKSKGSLSAQNFLLLTQHYLQRHPTDHSAWYEAGMLHLRHGSPQQAISLLDNARSQQSGNTTYDVTYAQALIASGSKADIAKALSLLDMLLKRLPTHEMVWMTLALAHQKNEDYPASITAWKQLRALRVANNGSVELVDRYLAVAKNKQKGGSANPSNAQAAAHSSVSKKTENNNTLLDVTVRRDDAIKSAITKGVLFVIVKHANRPMPIAVRKVTSATWPMTIAFNDNDSLMNTSLLSDAINDDNSALEVLARYSFKGVAKASSGDYFSRAVALKGSDLQLLIDQRVE